MTGLQDKKFMALALEEAQRAKVRDEVPIGAILVDTQTGIILARNGNRTIKQNDPSAHAEMLVIREACKKAGSQRIPGTTLYVTLEPCAMCAGAISFARIDRVVFGAPDSKGGGIKHGGKFFDQPTCHHRPTVKSSILADECAQILKVFFREKRTESKTR